MSSYLHRLASSAMQPAERIHPFVGSVFAGPENRLKPRPLVDDLEIADIAGLRRPAVSGNQDHQDGSPELQNLAALEFAKSDGPQQSPNLRSRLEQPTERASTPPPQVLRSPISSSANESAFKPLFPRGPLQTPAQAGTARTAAAGDGEHTNERAVTALTPMSSIVGAGPGKTEVAKNFGGRAVQSARNLPRMHRAVGEPDQIEIHIGRIEVAAVPPTATVPATRVSRKAESLTDYLARRDKRRS